MHIHRCSVQDEVSFFEKSLRNSEKMCYFAPELKKSNKFFINYSDLEK